MSVPRLLWLTTEQINLYSVIQGVFGVPGIKGEKGKRSGWQCCLSRNFTINLSNNWTSYILPINPNLMQLEHQLQVT